MATTTHPLRRIVPAGDADIYVDQRGTGPDVVLLAGQGDTVEVWEAQLAGLSDRFRVTAIDNRGAGRSSLPASGISVPAAAADAAAVIRELDLAPAHVMGFSGGGLIAQELAITEPGLIRSLVINGSFCEMDELMLRRTAAWLSMAAGAESPEAFLEQFLCWIYTREAHADGRADEWVREFLEFEHPMSDEVFVAWLEAFREHSTKDRLHTIKVPTLVIAGDMDLVCPPPYGREIADAIPGAELVVLPGQAHQPFQEIPDEWNALVTAFLDRVT
jgi:pimeloyl-ACP methyl ester carboxylesterase